MLNIFKPGAFRLFLSALVVFFHVTRYFPFGEFAVNTFFVLSGYWIYRMYDTFYEHQKNPYRAFILSRILRIFPLYYFCTALALILVAINSSLLYHHLSDFLNFEQVFAILTILPYNNLDQKLLPPVWSLAIEMQFYLIAPFFIFLLKKMNGKLFFILILLLSLWGMMTNFSIIQLSVVPYLLYFGAGMVIWHYKPLISKNFLLGSIILIGIIIYLHYTLPILQRALFVRDIFIGNFNYLFIFSSILPFLFIPFIIFSLSLKSEKKDRSLGDLSYTIYIFHWIPFSIYNYLFAKSSLDVRIPAFIGYLFVLGIFSWIIYVVFEKRIERLRKSILG